MDFATHKKLPFAGSTTTSNGPEVGKVVIINQINADGSLTEIGEMIDGEREDFPKEKQFTYTKIK